MLRRKEILTAVIGCLAVLTALASDRTINLVVSYKRVNFTGKYRKAIAVNDQIPAPTLHFKQGDHVTINVYNHLDRGTSIHWHGILVPWQMDGVDGVSQKPIPPGGVFHYRFTLYQSGTYWYHAHSGIQEQEGLYGAFLIDPPTKPQYHYTKDYVVVLSDWSNLPAEKVFADLKKDGEYFSPRFPLQPSLARFLHDYRRSTPQQRKKLVNDYLMMQHMRMSIYDISDIAYDAFLLNGHSNKHPWTAPVKVGDVVRLRFIGAPASTIYHVKIPGAVMRVVHVQGNDVKPYKVQSFSIAPGETVDVLVNIRKKSPYIIYAESADTLGAAYGALMPNPKQSADYQHVKPFPKPLPVVMHHYHPKKNPTTTGTKYQNLKAAVKTNNPNKPIAKIIHMQLFGWMDQYVWFINGLPEYKAKPIRIEPGKRYRLIFTNTSMMKHPMHIHGHWFILRNGHGAYDPLLHTIVVPPGATVVADIDADASGQWFFHCHHLYHMMAGMAQVFQYSTIIAIEKGIEKPQDFVKEQPYINRPIVREDITRPLDRALIKYPLGHPAGFYFSTFLKAGEDPFQNIQKITLKGMYGSDYHKIELFTEEAEMEKGRVTNADIDIFYRHPVDQFWAIKGGVNYFYRPALSSYWQLGFGVEGLMPYFIDTDIRVYYYAGTVKFDLDLGRSTQITNNFFIRLGIRSIFATKTVVPATIGSGLNQMRYTIEPYYRIEPGVNLFTEYEYERNYGVFKQLELSQGEAANENKITFGASLLF